MTNKYVLYGGGVARDVVVRMVLDEAGLPHDIIFVDGVSGAHRTVEFRKLNPAGYIPALVTPDGQALFETAAIMLYLVEKHDMTDLAPLPGDPDRGPFLSRLFFHTSEIQPSFKRWFYPHRFSTDGASGREKVMNSAYEMLMDRWAVMDKMLADDGPYHLGDRFSVLDMHIAMWATYGLKNTDDIIEKFPHVRSVVEDVVARPKSGYHLVALRKEITHWRERTDHLATKTGTY